MTILLARLKQAAKWLAAIALLVGAAALAFFRFRRHSVPARDDPVDLALARYERQTTLAGAQYVVETAAARATLKVEQARLMDILRDTDEDRRADRLIAEAARLKGE